ncbi:CCA tRNA nucleotidyltransferase [Patescibacteria group bacterium]|nr:CCA tRNA nucleotidyltransferase [Patescibacteria group bacterium]MCL5409729.1 CCA tRNA nucleotidyltransferase [Patescibacteria group bacterium]
MNLNLSQKKMMTELLPKTVKTFMDKITNNGFQVFVVGGAVRDLIMQRPVDDWDFTTDARPDDIVQMFPQSFYDNNFGTVGVKIEDDHQETIFEITTMRKEGQYQDSRHPLEVSWTNKIGEDLARRDFTINALALSTQGNIIDPYTGQEDLHRKIVRAVGHPQDRFQEDALRLIRAIRIATQLGFDIESNTYQAIKQNAQLISNIAPERIREELFKLLESANPYIGIKELQETGILDILFPELTRCFGIQQEGPKHTRIYDIGEHSVEALKFTPSTDPLVRLATLLHDIGKPDTYNIDQTGNVTFYNHDLVGGRLILQIAKRFNLSKKQTDKLYRLVRWHLFTVDDKQTDAAIRRFIKNVGKENINDMIALRIGDRLGGGTQNPVSWRMEKFRSRINQVLQKPFSITDLQVDGQDVMSILNIPPSRKVGEVLKMLFQEVINDSSKNNREYLITRIKQLA